MIRMIPDPSPSAVVPRYPLSLTTQKLLFFSTYFNGIIEWDWDEWKNGNHVDFFWFCVRYNNNVLVESECVVDETYGCMVMEAVELWWPEPNLSELAGSNEKHRKEGGGCIYVYMSQSQS